MERKFDWHGKGLRAQTADGVRQNSEEKRIKARQLYLTRRHEDTKGSKKGHKDEARGCISTFCGRNLDGDARRRMAENFFRVDEG
jgi:hypothetical protein